jgi:DNA-directed RNA polymerase specialized sigma subunit
VKKRNYIDNKRFEEVISLYLKDPKNHEDELIKLFDILISNIIEGFKFSVDKDDAKQDCFFLIIKTLKNFKGDRGTAFNYFTTVIVNNLKLIYTKNKKYRERLNKYIEDLTGPKSPTSHK